VAVLALGTAFIGSGLYVNGVARHAVRQTRQSLFAKSDLDTRIYQLTETLHGIESTLYRFAVSGRGSERDHALALFDRLRQQTGALQRRIGAGQGAMTGQVAAFERESRTLRGAGQRFLSAAAEVPEMKRAAAETSIPGSRHASAGGSEAALLSTVAREWNEAAADYRGYLASLNGVFPVASALTFRNALTEHRRRLAALRRRLAGMTGQGRSPRLRNVVRVLTDDAGAFGKLPGSWPKGEVRQQMERSWTRLRRLQQQLAAEEAQWTLRSLGMADGLTHFVWVISALAATLLLGAYLIYEALIRRPILQVSEALRAVGRGDATVPELASASAETEHLLAAFREMQAQVFARQTRLSSILDNASEGIITINERGEIETFNNAAESLFGYPAAAVLGRSVDMLMPKPVRHEHGDYVAQYLETGERRVIGNEINVNGQRSDGSVFPLSIKLSEMVLEGERYFTAIVVDISERKAMMDHLRRLAEHDALTGLRNRQYFMAELERVVGRALRSHGSHCALLYIDLDNFKYVNDTMGHLAGDKVLVEVSHLLSSRSRRSDLLARLGGDEFAVLLYDVDCDEALQTAEMYRQLLSDYTFRHDTRFVDIGCSIGVALLGEDVADKEDLLARADISCHMAKRAGRNSVHLYRAEDRARMDSMTADIGWARVIKEAIEKDRFVFALQPILDVNSREVVTREVLLRMLGEESGELIMPGVFISAAERFGLVQEIDRWVIRRGLRYLSERAAQGHREHLSINLSGQTVNDPKILDLITDTLHESGVDPTQITFEITETVAIADLSVASSFLEHLRVLGCKTALDDFGVGYCSFAYLKDLPVDYVKIDGSFVREIASDAVQWAMVKSMNEIAHAMDKRTVAEFVDNDKVLRILQEIGVDFVQGYLTGRLELVDMSPPQGAVTR